MSRKKIRITAVLGAVSLAFLAAYGWHSVTAIGRPTQEEYAVYSSFLHHLAADKLFERKKLIVVNRSAALQVPKYDDRSPYSPPTPEELRITNIDESLFPDFAKFCGNCASDFARKNLRIWPLSNLEFSQVDATIGSGANDDHPVSLSRVGFNLWHSRAVLAFTADCSDAERSMMCIEMGQAYLKSKNGKWTVEKVLATLH